MAEGDSIRRLAGRLHAAFAGQPVTAAEFRRGGEVPVRFVGITHKMMRQGLRTGTQSTTGNLRRGESHWVYGRYRRPCRRCGTPIEFRPAGAGPYDREAWWCPRCPPPV